MMNRSRQVAEALAARGLVNNVSQAERVIEELTHDDYIPNGGPIRSVDSEIMPAPVDARCGVSLGSDIQSGPYYCGEPATLCFKTGNGLACTCRSHEYVLRETVARLKKK